MEHHRGYEYNEVGQRTNTDELRVIFEFPMVLMIKKCFVLVAFPRA